MPSTRTLLLIVTGLGLAVGAVRFLAMYDVLDDDLAGLLTTSMLVAGVLGLLAAPLAMAAERGYARRISRVGLVAIAGMAAWMSVLSLIEPGSSGGREWVGLLFGAPLIVGASVAGLALALAIEKLVPPVDAAARVLRRAGAAVMVMATLLLDAGLVIAFWTIDRQRFGPTIDERFFEVAATCFAAGIVTIVAALLVPRMLGHHRDVGDRRRSFDFTCPRCAARSTLRTGGDVCPRCRLRVTVRMA